MDNIAYMYGICLSSVYIYVYMQKEFGEDIL